MKVNPMAQRRTAPYSPSEQEIYISNSNRNEIMVEKYDVDDNYVFSFTTQGLASVMAIAHHPE